MILVKLSRMNPALRALRAMNICHIIIEIALSSVVVCTLFGQSQVTLRFEVSSVKRNTTTEAHIRDFAIQPGGRFISTNATVRLLIQNAYQLRGFQVLGGPNWIDSDGYDIDARPTPEVEITKAQTWKMLQSLLEERFALRTHLETRELPLYLLEVEKSGAKLPVPKEGACTPPGQPVAQGQEALMPCGTAAVSITPKETRLVGGRVSIAELARILTTLLGRQVIDKTALTPFFDVNLVFSPDQATGLVSDLATAYKASPDPNTVTIFTALREQLGLKLSWDKGPTRVLVIDSVQRPYDN